MVIYFYSALFSFNKPIQSIAMSHILKYRYYSSVKFQFQERIVQIQTCGPLYRQWKKENVYTKIPESNLVFNVPYIDTSLDSSDYSGRELSRTVLALHGAPGSWRVFTNLSTYLHQRGHRVIAPSFPDFHVYRPGIFRHSDLEKAQYLKDFLEAINVSQVDLLICHSSAVYPSLNLCVSNGHPKIKSLALLNTSTFNRKGMSATKPFTFLKAFVKASENPLLLKILEAYGPYVWKNILKVRVKFESILDPLLTATAMVNGHISESKEKFQQIVSQKLPILYIFSENDPLISLKPSYELAETLGAHSSEIFKYNKEGVLIQEGKATKILKVFAFQEGSHYAFLKYPDIINKEIANFLDLEGNSSSRKPS